MNLKGRNVVRSGSVAFKDLLNIYLSILSINLIRLLYASWSLDSLNIENEWGIAPAFKEHI